MLELDPADQRWRRIILRTGIALLVAGLLAAFAGAVLIGPAHQISRFEVPGTFVHKLGQFLMLGSLFVILAGYRVVPLRRVFGEQLQPLRVHRADQSETRRGLNAAYATELPPSKSSLITTSEPDLAPTPPPLPFAPMNTSLPTPGVPPISNSPEQGQPYEATHPATPLRPSLAQFQATTTSRVHPGLAMALIGGLMLVGFILSIVASTLTSPQLTFLITSLNHILIVAVLIMGVIEDRSTFRAMAAAGLIVMLPVAWSGAGLFGLAAQTLLAEGPWLNPNTFQGYPGSRNFGQPFPFNLGNLVPWLTTLVVMGLTAVFRLMLIRPTVQRD